MAQPTGSDLFVSRVLTNVSVAYMQGAEDFIADKVFPPVPVKMRAGIYYIYNKGDWFRTAAQKRAPRTESAGTGWTKTSDTYAIDVNAIHVDVADQDRADAEEPFDLDRDAARLTMQDLLLRREKDFITAFFGTGIWSQTTQTGVAAAPAANQFLQWNASAATPIEDIEEQRIAMGKLTGYRPNTLVLGPEVFSALKNSSQLLERIKYTQRGQVTLDLMASLFEVDKVLVPYAIENTAEEGATDNFNFLYGKTAILVYAAPNAGIMNPSAGYTFEWTGYLGATRRGVRTKKFRMEHLNADRVEGESAYTFKKVSADLGVTFTAAVA